MEIKPQAVAIPKSTAHLEKGKYGPVFPKTPACYGFTIVADLKPGKAEAMRGYGERLAKAVEANPQVLAPLKLHYLRWVLFDNDTRFMYQGIFDTDFDKYTEDAVVLFGQTGIEAGEFIIGYTDETGGHPPVPSPETLGRNGTYVVFRKLHQRVAEFRRYLKASARSEEEEELLAAKMMGRWRSGAPLALCPFHDDPELGADPHRNNDFVFADDPIGYKTPPGSHIRRANPRDASVAGVVRLHRMLRRGTVYGPELPPGVLEDDGVDRGLMFAFIGAHPGRQFEFAQSEWLNQGEFLGIGDTKDPIAGAHEGSGSYSIPKRPIADVRAHATLRQQIVERVTSAPEA